MITIITEMCQDFPGGPVAKTLHSQCRGPGSDPWSGNQVPHMAQLKFHVQRLKNKIPRVVNKTQYSPPKKCPRPWTHSCTEHRLPVYPLKASLLAEKYLSYSGVCIVWAMQTLMTKSDVTLAENTCQTQRQVRFFCCCCSCPTLCDPHGLLLARLLRPWDSPGKNNGVGCHFLLQGIFPTQGLNPGLPHWRQTL